MTSFCCDFVIFTILLAAGFHSAASINFCGVIIWPPLQPKNAAHPVALRSVNVTAQIRGWTAGVTATLEYDNFDTNENIEAEFVFPLSDKAALYRLEAVIDGRTLFAELKDRASAETEYQEAVSSGSKAVFLESQQGNSDVYRLRLGNLPPNASATVKIGYVQPVDRIYDDGVLSYTLPTVLNPRYIPVQQLNDTDFLKKKFLATTPFVAVSSVKYKMTFSASIDIGENRKIAKIEAGNSKDEIEIEFFNSKQNGNVKLIGDFVQDHDFKLLIEPLPKFSLKPTIYVEPGTPSLFPLSFMKSWLNYDVVAAWYEPPKFEQDELSPSNDEYWLVIDQSGSMWGQKIRDAKAALGLFVKSLPMGCRFNIIGFGSTFNVFFPNGSVVYDETSMSRAALHSKSLSADLGGTEILEPLDFIYSQPWNESSDSNRFIILLTDGEVFNTDEVIALAKENAFTTRVFSVGIGEGASTDLVNGVARVSNGLAEFVRSESCQAKVISMLKATTQTSATEVELDWQVVKGGSIMATAPKELAWTAVYAGGEVSQYAAIDRNWDQEAEGSVTLKANVEGNITKVYLPFKVAKNEYSDVDDPLSLHRLSAKRVLVELTDEYNLNGIKEIRDRIVTLSVATGVLSEFTAFVAIDDEEVDANVTKPPRFVVVERPTEYLNNEQNIQVVGRTAYARRPVGMSSGGLAFPGMRGQALQPVGSAGPYGPAYATSQQHLSGYGYIPMSSGPAPPPPPPSLPLELFKNEADKRRQNDAFMEVIMAQNFNGSWNLNDELLQYLGVELDDVTLAFNDYDEQDSHFMATAVSLSWLRSKYEDKKVEWQLIERKALEYLTKSCGFPGDVDSLLDDISVELKLL